MDILYKNNVFWYNWYEVNFFCVFSVIFVWNILLVMSRFLHVFFVSGLFLCVFAGKAQESDSLRLRAKALFDQGPIEQAVMLYAQIARKDSADYEANVFLGNYYFLLASKICAKTDSVYGLLLQPTRMQTAQYQDKLKEIDRLYYEKADGYLRRALKNRNNTYIQMLLKQMEDFRVRMDLVPVAKKKRKS